MSSLFDNAPVTLGFSLLCLVTSYVYGGANKHNLDMGKLLDGEIWRIFASHVIFQSMPEIFFGLILLYTCRQFERQMGSRKYGAFLVFCWIISTLLLLAISAICGSMGIHFVPSSGPYFFIFAQLAFFYRYIPKIYVQQYVVLGFPVSEKSGIYLLAVQLMLGQGFSSILAAACGFLAGFLYDRDGFGIQKMRLPKFIENIFKSLGSVLSVILPSTSAAGPANRPALPGGARTPPPNGPTRIQESFEMPPPDEESITALVNMGFERNAVIAALRANGNNVEAAANMLLR